MLVLRVASSTARRGILACAKAYQLAVRAFAMAKAAYVTLDASVSRQPEGEDFFYAAVRIFLATFVAFALADATCRNCCASTARSCCRGSDRAGASP